MTVGKTLGLATVLVVAVAGCILVDSWFEDDVRIAPDGEGPVLHHEIAGKSARIELEVETTPAPPLTLAVPDLDIDLPPATSLAEPPPRPRPVDPSGWLGRRHLRSPT